MKTMCMLPVALASYEVTIRSFHPEKDFGWSGLCFAGDNRGFSTSPSQYKGNTTSRIWQKFAIDPGNGKVSSGHPKSDESRAAWAEAPHEYRRQNNPRGEVRIVEKRHSDDMAAVHIVGYYAGENDAMPGSESMRNIAGISYVPTLNVYHELWMFVNREDWELDMLLYVYGDGFPNCEAFVTDPSGHAVFLGTYVRAGAAPTTLALNLRLPMISSGLRVQLTKEGLFRGQVGDLIAMAKSGSSAPRYQSIGNWNARMAHGSPNLGHSMGLEKGILRKIVCGALDE